MGSLAVVMAVLLVWFFASVADGMYEGACFGIKNYQSAVDKDGDGIDDQTDLLAGVRAYLDTKPKYKSQYYSTGYPDDGYGVCTDVVARGMLAAGYDLMILMTEDIAAHPERYDADVGDSKIAFRRVRNQLSYFEGNAISLTTNIYNIRAWQGGDIVVFKGHVGVVSDKRNWLGIPYILHHGSSEQKEYEEDILMKKQMEILGHYRIS